MPAPSLMSLAKKACQKYYRRIRNVGPLPYEMVRFFITKIETAEQLHEIEVNSPQIAGKDAEIWQHFVTRDIDPKIRDEYDYVPEDPADWYLVYKKLKAKAEKQRQKDAEAIGEALASSKSARSAPKLISSLNSLKLPSQRGRQQSRSSTTARAGKSLLNDLRGTPRVNKVSNSLRIAPSAVSHVRRVGQVAKAPIRMLEESMEAESRNKARGRAGSKAEPAGRQAPTSSSAAAAAAASAAAAAARRTPVDPANLSVVERRRQAEERLKGIGIQPRQTSPPKAAPEPRAGEKRQLIRRQAPVNVFAAKKSRTSR